MKIDYLNGCSYSMTVDGIEFVDLSEEKQKEVCHRIIGDNKCDFFTMKKFYEYYYECDKDLEFDDEEETNIDVMDDNKLKKLCNSSIDSEECSEATLQTLVECFMERNGRYKHLGYCNTCGSQNDNYTIEI